MCIGYSTNKFNSYLDECCYVYGSVPRNNTNCVPEGGRLNLNYIIYNPHDIFTNLTVTWFRSTTEDIMSNYETLPTMTTEYQYLILNANKTFNLSMRNCGFDVYRDTFSIVISNFTRNKNGYYWCQFAINNTYVQRSHHAWFYAGEQNSTTCSGLYFGAALANETQCAEYATTPSITSSLATYESPTASSSASSKASMTRSSSGSLITTLSVTAPQTTLLTPTNQEQENERAVIYVAGSLGALVVTFGALVIVLSILYLRKFRNREPSKFLAILICDNINMHTCSIIKISAKRYYFQVSSYLSHHHFG